MDDQSREDIDILSELSYTGKFVEIKNNSVFDIDEVQSYMDDNIKTTIVRPVGQVIIEGELYKLSPNTFRGWQRRYFVLSNTTLKYYKSLKHCLDGKHPKGVISFQHIKVDLKREKKERQFSLTLQGCKRVFYFRAVKASDYELWVNSLTSVIMQSDGYFASKEINEQLFSVEIWKFPLITEE